jgi:hypothetical protein
MAFVVLSEYLEPSRLWQQLELQLGYPPIPEIGAKEATFLPERMLK